jgi:hypothetical protein
MTYRPRRTNRRAVAAAVVVGGALAFGSPHHHHHHGGGLLDSLAAVPVSAGASHSRVAWARAFLRAIPEPRTACNVGAVVAWETAEGGGFGNQAQANPLNVNPGAGAGWPGYPATGAWAFPDTATGIAYSAQTIRNGYYPGILAALRAGNNAQAVANAIEDSPWAASHYGYGLTAAC